MTHQKKYGPPFGPTNKTNLAIKKKKKLTKLEKCTPFAKWQDAIL